MAHWVFSDWWQTWVADCGPYIGPFPPAPPTLGNFPGGDLYLAYMISLPNPSGDPALVADGTYPTNYVLRSRQLDLSVDPPVPASVDGGGLANVWVQLDGDPAFDGVQPGAHLYVFWEATPPDLPPTVTDPFTLVPQQYVASGTGHNVATVGVPGEWHPTQDKTESAGWGFGDDNHGCQSQVNFQHFGDSTFIDPNSFAPPIIAEVLAGTDVIPTGGVARADLTVLYNTWSGGGIAQDNYYQEVDLTMEQQRLRLRAFASIDNSRFYPAWPLIEGIDFLVASNNGSSLFFYQYWESPDVTFLGWEDGTATLVNQNWGVTGDVFDPDHVGPLVDNPGPFSSGVRISIVEGASDVLWEPGVGDDFLSVITPYTGFAEPGVNMAVTLPFSGITGGVTNIGGLLEIDLVLYLQNFFELGLAFPQATFHPGGSFSSAGFFVFSDAFLLPDNVPFHYRVPRYRLLLVPAETYLRLNQRDDGLGISGHARLHGPNGPTSRQLSRMQRIGEKNTYS